MTHQLLVLPQILGSILGQAIGRVARVVIPELYLLGFRIVEFEEYRSSLAVVSSSDEV